MKIRGTIFDVDGTLLDSNTIWHTVGERYLRSLGYEPKGNLGEIFWDMSLKEAVRYYRREYGIKLSVDQIIEGVNATLERFYFESAQLKPGVRQMLSGFAERGVSMCIATTTDRYLIEAALQRCGILSCFDRIFTCGGVGHSKSSPYIFEAALHACGTDKSETPVFEDALYAIVTAKRAGFPIIGIYDKYEKKDAKVRELSDFYVESYPAVLTDLLRMADKSVAKPTYKKGQTDTAMYTALSIAGTDPTGGAGIQADLKAMTMNGVFAMSVITALVAQNTTGVTSILEVPPDFLAQQLDCVCTDIFPDAIKIGMVSSAPLIEVIADKLTQYSAKNVVVDPVMVSTSGDRLIEEEATDTLKRLLFPLATVITPNIPEAEILYGKPVTSRSDMEVAARTISEEYGCAVLCKGGHQINDANDYLYASGHGEWLHGKRIDNPNTHGTGCTLSSTIAANLAKGFDLSSAVRRAKDYLSGALGAMLDLGHGSGPLQHNFNLSGTFAQDAAQQT